MADDVGVLNVTELAKVDALQDGDTLLLIRGNGSSKECYRILGSDFRGKSAYEVAQELGFTGGYDDWKSQVSKVANFGVDYNPENGTLEISI